VPATAVLARSTGPDVAVDPAPTRAVPTPRRRDHDPGRRRAILAAALVAAGGVAGLAFLLAHRTTVPVPELRGLPAAGVSARARHTHVRAGFSRRYADAPVGIAIAQTPKAGTRVEEGSRVAVVLSAGPPPVRVPQLVGQAATAAEQALTGDGLRYAVATVPAAGASAGAVLRQAPAAAASVPRGSTVTLSVAEAPRWRTLTTFAGVDDGESVPVQILGKRWRVSYSMSYEGTCLLVITCFGPSARALHAASGSTSGSFDLGEGSGQTHTFTSGPGVYRVQVSGGQDSARWSMTIQDYY
jgi:hypothetical protein